MNCTNILLFSYALFSRQRNFLLGVIWSSCKATNITKDSLLYLLYTKYLYMDSLRSRANKDVKMNIMEIIK